MNETTAVLELDRPQFNLAKKSTRCCRCGWPSWAGILTDADSALLPFCPDNTAANN